MFLKITLHRVTQVVKTRLQGNLYRENLIIKVKGFYTTPHHTSRKMWCYIPGVFSSSSLEVQPSRLTSDTVFELHDLARISRRGILVVRSDNWCGEEVPDYDFVFGL